MQGIASQIAVQNANQWEWDVLRQERLRELNKRKQQNRSNSNTTKQNTQQQKQQAQQSQQSGFKPTQATKQKEPEQQNAMFDPFLNTIVIPISMTSYSQYRFRIWDGIHKLVNG